MRTYATREDPKPSASPGQRPRARIQAKCGCSTAMRSQSQPGFDDAAEREAEAVASKISAGTARGPISVTQPAIARKCAECASEQASEIEGGLPTGGGRPLADATRSKMESALGRDFADVRVHTGAQASQLNAQLGAQAFTYGSDIYFDEGRYEPGSKRGEHLLAHELVHVAQQAGGAGSPALQRAPADKDKPRKDVVFITSRDLGAEAKVLAPDGEVIAVKSLREMAAKLRSIRYPIKRLFVVSHSLASGDLEFEDEKKQAVFVPPDKIADALRGTVSSKNAPELIDFRGCSVGSSPQAMADIREALGAGAAVGGTCFSIIQPNGPISIDGKPITKAGQIKDRAAFNDGMKRLVDSFGPAKDCILDRSEEAYFRAGGKMFAVWYNPEFSTEWDKRHSKCRSALVPETVDPKKPESADEALARELTGECKLVRVEK